VPDGRCKGKGHRLAGQGRGRLDNAMPLQPSVFKGL